MFWLFALMAVWLGLGFCALAALLLALRARDARQAVADLWLQSHVGPLVWVFDCRGYPDRFTAVSESGVPLCQRLAPTNRHGA